MKKETISLIVTYTIWALSLIVGLYFLLISSFSPSSGSFLIGLIIILGGILFIIVRSTKKYRVIAIILFFVILLGGYSFLKFYPVKACNALMGVFKDSCFYNFGVTFTNYKYCTFMEGCNEGICSQRCLQDVAKKTNDARVCGFIDDKWSVSKPECYKSIMKE